MLAINPVRVIIAGSRGYDYGKDDFEYINDLLDPYFDFDNWIPRQGVELVTGCCPKGPDNIPFLYKDVYGIPVKEFPVEPSDWNKHGKKAGHLRNEQMAKYADILICLWDGISSGSANMIENAKKYKLRYHIKTQG